MQAGDPVYRWRTLMDGGSVVTGWETKVGTQSPSRDEAAAHGG